MKTLVRKPKCVSCQMSLVWIENSTCTKDTRHAISLCRRWAPQRPMRAFPGGEMGLAVGSQMRAQAGMGGILNFCECSHAFTCLACVCPPSFVLLKFGFQGTSARPTHCQHPLYSCCRVPRQRVSVSVRTPCTQVTAKLTVALSSLRAPFTQRGEGAN